MKIPNSASRRIEVAAFPLRKWHSTHTPGAFVPQEPKPWRFIEPLHERAIIMPWLSTGETWIELRCALRSIRVHFTDRECPIYLLCDRKPGWIREDGRLIVREMPGYRESNREGLREAWEFGCQIAAEVAWWNDDIYLLRETGWDDLRVALTEGALEEDANMLRASNNGWRRDLGNAAEALKLNGFENILRFATHTPYLFEADKAREIAASYHLPFSGAFETLYHTHHQTPHEPIGSAKTENLPCHGKPRYYNHGRYGPDEAAKAELGRLFPDPAPWELVLTKQAPAILTGAVPALVSMASFPPRAKGLERVVKDLLPQCDGLRVYLNGYDEIPDFLPDDQKLSIVLAGPNSEYPDMGSHGKWHWLGQEDCHHLTVDDDIFYHDGYVRHMVAACGRLNDKAIVGLHGYRFRFLQRGKMMASISIPRMRAMRTYHQFATEDWPTHALGSGVMCCRPSMIGLSQEALGGAIHSGDDEDLAIWAQIHKVPMVRVASPLRLTEPNDTEWRKDALHARPAFKDASDSKLRSYTNWTLHNP